MTKPYDGPCKGSKRCPAMALALDGDARAGLCVAWAFPSMAETIVYKPKRKSPAITLNLCPWCGAKLTPKTKRALASRKETDHG